MMRLNLIVALAFALLLSACGPKTGKKTDKSVASPEKRKSPIELYTDSIAMDSTNAVYYLERARLYFNREEIGNAFSDVSKALKYDKNNVDAYLLLAEIYYGLGDEQNITLALTRAADIDPTDARPLVRLAELSLLRENLNLALVHLDKALAISNYNPRAYYIRGELFLMRGDTISAIKNYQIARTQDESFYEPTYAVGSLYADMGDKLAVEYLTDAIKRFPEYPALRYRLAMFMQENGNPNEALSHYDTLLMEQPDNPYFIFNKGYVHFVYFSNYDEALDCFDKALALNPKYLDALYNKAYVMELTGDLRQAATLYREVLLEQPDYKLAIDALNRLGR